MYVMPFSVYFRGVGEAEEASGSEPHGSEGARASESGSEESNNKYKR